MKLSVQHCNQVDCYFAEKQGFSGHDTGKLEGL